MTEGRSRYPLAGLEATRRRAVDAARGGLTAAIATAELARAGVDAAEAARREAVRRCRAEERPAGSSAVELEVRGRWIARLRGEEVLLRDEVEARAGVAEAARAEMEARRERLVEAERQLRTVERHREKWERARLRAARTAEEAEQDDRASAYQRLT